MLAIFLLITSLVTGLAAQANAQTATPTPYSGGSGLCSCMCCLLPILIPFFLVMIVVIHLRSRGDNSGEAASPQQSIDHLARKLTSDNEAARREAAGDLKELDAQLMSVLLPTAHNAYVKYLRAVDNYNNQIRLKVEGRRSEVIANELGERFRDGLFENAIKGVHNHWKNVLDGINLYINVSCRSPQTGLIELAWFTYKNMDKEYLFQARSALKYGGIGYVEPLLVLMRSPRPEIRAGSMILVAGYNDIRSYGPIKSALRDESPAVRDIAAICIKELNIQVAEDREIYVEKETVLEIVKIPCKYCGTLIENTSRACASCGAPLKPY